MQGNAFGKVYPRLLWVHAMANVILLSCRKRSPRGQPTGQQALRVFPTAVHSQRHVQIVVLLENALVKLVEILEIQYSPELRVVIAALGDVVHRCSGQHVVRVAENADRGLLYSTVMPRNANARATCLLTNSRPLSMRICSGSPRPYGIVLTPASVNTCVSARKTSRSTSRISSAPTGSLKMMERSTSDVAVSVTQHHQLPLSILNPVGAVLSVATLGCANRIAQVNALDQPFDRRVGRRRQFLIEALAPDRLV